MRQIKMVLVMLVCAVMAQAGEYGYLLFSNTGGTTTALTVNNLSATVSGSALVVSNDEGTVNFSLTELASMQFSTTDSLSALENVLNGDLPVQVFSISGTSLGTYDNLLQAARQLSAGAYVISDGKHAQTIIVR